MMDKFYELVHKIDKEIEYRMSFGGDRPLTRGDLRVILDAIKASEFNLPTQEGRRG